MNAFLLIILLWLNPDPKEAGIYVFLACECPISQKYVPVLNSIYSTYKDTPGFKWTFVVPGKVKKSEIEEFIKEYGVQFPVEADPRIKTVKKLHASTTPEVIIVRDTVLYSGAIDNWFYELGKYRREATEHYLIDALEAIKGGREPIVKKTEALGCPIAIPQ